MKILLEIILCLDKEDTIKL